MQNIKLAIDVGGTFTDLVLYDAATGCVDVHKLLSTNHDPSVGSLAGAVELLRRRGVDGSQLSEFVHATTVATNAVIERKGAMTALITTRGFRDALEIRNEDRYDIYDLSLQQPQPLVSRYLRREVTERIDVHGTVVEPLAVDEVRAVFRDLQAQGVNSVAVSLLNAHVNPVHEQLIAELASEFPAIETSISHRVANESREYERTSTCVVDAYVKPIVKNYIDRLVQGFKALGLRNSPALMLSNGGIGSAVQVAQHYPVRMIESGPAAGAVLAAHLSRTSLEGQDLVALDIGGTTAKVSLIQGGTPEVTHLLEVAHLNKFSRGSGFPLQIAAIELLEISGGGGSIARVNELQGISVGPDSAGSMPGPAAFGRGGMLPTVTDCDLILGYLDPASFAGGTIPLDVAAARKAIEHALAKPLQMSIERAAQGVVDLINERMAAAVRVHAAEKGVDLRGFSLMAFGGNGPLHAFGVARTLGVRTIVVPFAAGVASAIGCVVAEPAIDYTEPVRTPLKSADWTAIDALVAGFLDKGSSALREFVDDARARTRVMLDLRCVGQGYHISILLPDKLSHATAATDIERLFQSRYAELYGHPPPAVPIEIVNLRVTTFMPRNAGRVVSREQAGSGTPMVGRRSIHLDGKEVEATIYRRDALPRDVRFSGPALVVERETTTLVGVGAEFYRHSDDHLIINLL
jgi:N-methylhydantoinase A